MFTRHISRQLAAHLDGQLAPPPARQAEFHLRQCGRCRAELEQVRQGMTIVEHLPTVKAPEGVWLSIEAALPEWRPRQAPTVPWWRWASVAAGVVLALAAAAYWRVARSPEVRWEVVRIAGEPAVGAKPFLEASRVGAGEWIATDARSRAVIKVGEIGSVEVAPNTRVRVVTTRVDEHRIALARGEIRATISAPPRLFFVNTASGIAADLGCEYELKTDEEGLGLLRVTKGWVSFQWEGLESLIPAGASCPTRPRAGPGIPYFDDATETLKEALDALGTEKNRGDAIGIILSESRVRDTLTLWHLLSRVEAADRVRVFDRIAALTPVPTDVSRERALQLDPDTLKRWKEALAWTW